MRQPRETTMIADLMPRWLWCMLKLHLVVLDGGPWTWRHTLRFGRDPQKMVADYRRYRERQK